MAEVESSSTSKKTRAGGERWWGDFSIDIDRAGRWRVGPTTLWIERHEFEWRVTHWQDGDPMDASMEINVPASIVREEIPEDIVPNVGRYSFEATQSLLRVLPALADRPVIVKPEEPLFVLPDETVTMYVSTPLWIRVMAGEEHSLLTEIPSYRPSDSWFGSNTREGELCYATASLGRLRLADIPRRLHRAITPVVIRNRSVESLSVDRIRVPVEYLSLLQDDEGYLWTESIRFDKVAQHELATLHISRGSPTSAVGAKMISGPRQSHDRSVLVRAFASLMNRITEE